MRNKFPLYRPFLHTKASPPLHSKMEISTCRLPIPPQDFSDIRYRDPPDSKWIDRSGPNSCDKLRRSTGPRGTCGAGANYSLIMVNSQSQSEHVSEVDTAILDAELFIKYKAPEKAIERLRTALERNPRSLPLRERLREIAITSKHTDEAARQCLGLASIYIEREDFSTAHERLLEAKHLDPRINIAGGLEAIRRARRPDLSPAANQTETVGRTYATLAGDLASISVFDAVQVLENSKLTGELVLTSDSKTGRVFFNEGRIVDAESAGAKGEAGFRRIVEITNGSFEFQKSSAIFPVTITALSNTNLLLDTLRQLDEAAVEGGN
jgi:tetratricopeptide (TPR) repeat protein